MPCRNAYIETYRRSKGKHTLQDPRPTLGNRIGPSNYTKLECFKVDTFSFRILFTNKGGNAPITLYFPYSRHIVSI